MSVRAKYVEERFPRWFVFGQTATHVDIADSEGDVFRGVPLETAEKLIAARDTFVDALISVFDDDVLAARSRCGGDRVETPPALTWQAEPGGQWIAERDGWMAKVTTDADEHGEIFPWRVYAPTGACAARGQARSLDDAKQAAERVGLPREMAPSVLRMADTDHAAEDYCYLAASPIRSDAEEARLQALRATLEARGQAPAIEPVPRRTKSKASRGSSLRPSTSVPPPRRYTSGRHALHPACGHDPSRGGERARS